MGDKSKIEWLDGGASWNPITGCTPISEGCANCYAKTMAETRLRGKFGYAQEDPFKITFHEDKLNQPLEWKRPRKIFVCSMGDLFHADVPTEWINKVFSVIQQAKQHTFIILTKRPERMQQYIRSVNKCRSCPENDIPFSNVWCGITAENQRTADGRIPILLSTPAVKKFISVEPMLERIDIMRYLPEYDYRPTYEYYQKAYPDCGNVPILIKPGIDWIICGAETGPNARPMSLEWARDLRDQCAEANTPFFFKKAGPVGTPIPEDLTIREYPELSAGLGESTE